MVVKKNCLIIGASGGIGNAITKKLAEQNCNFFLIGKNKNKLLKLKKEIKKDDIIVEIESVDLTNEKQINKSIKKIRKTFGKIDILINTSGVFLIKSIDKTTIEEFEESFKINVRAPFIFSKEFSKDMKKSKWGRIVNIGSSSAYNGFKNSTAYCSSKHALLGFSRALFSELKDNNVRVYSISPGSTQTKMGKLSKDQKFETFLEPKEVADYVAFVIEFDKQLISEEIRLNRMQIE
jgi:short-subunit dehydrogenase